MKVRQVKPPDAEQLVKLISHVESTSDFMLFEAGERNLSAEQFRKRIESFGEDASTILISENEGALTGYLMVIAGGSKRNKHSAYLVIGISREFRGQGIGKALFAELDNWARKQNLHRLELTVMKTNAPGVALYEKAGFQIEGVKKNSLLVNGEYIDEYYMAKLI
ncbi:GNAT family N-acetyltransferase [Sporosarcina thermotolerans]|uniref:GNAT family N-acetyltransferase n=1 Tax=Sporosarcina thermotolerans TaxID=633404 RepID=A0AAW9A559_9BACL|nr:GNAT family N-acetyltransferase [Sporosarcina thermotolerans]MDW0115979.1 GNAT family N-acetyltransferase [Sporosarcina thermotolerans]WHT46816.1 GNAT family N-acetyltransferase [Sporosarcina thermotolerans]